MFQAGELEPGVFLHIGCRGEQNCLDWTQLRISQLGTGEGQESLQTVLVGLSCRKSQGKNWEGAGGWRGIYSEAGVGLGNYTLTA